MKRILSLLTIGTLITLLVAFALAQVPASLIRSGVIFGTPSAQSGSGLVLVEEHTASNSAALNFTSGITSTYDDYKIRVVGMVPATASVSIQIQFSSDGGATYDTGTNYEWSNYAFLALASGNEGNNSDIGITIGTKELSATGTPPFAGEYSIADPLSASKWKNVYGQGFSLDTRNSGSNGIVTAGSYQSTTAVNAFRVIATTGNITSGTVRLYGLAK